MSEQPKKQNSFVTPNEMAKMLLAQAHAVGAQHGLSPAECDRIACVVAAHVGQWRFSR